MLERFSLFLVQFKPQPNDPQNEKLRHQHDGQSVHFFSTLELAMIWVAIRCQANSF